MTPQNLRSLAQKGKHHSPATEFKDGNPSPYRGHHPTAELRLQVSLARKGRHYSPRTEFKKGQYASPKCIAASAERFKSLNKDPEFIKKRLKALVRHPTSPEVKLIKIIEDYHLPYKYTGNGSFIIANCNPDFVNVNGHKIAVEVFGDYWHTLKADRPSYTESGRTQLFAEYGWTLIVIWESQLNNESAEAIARRLTCQE